MGYISNETSEKSKIDTKITENDTREEVFSKTFSDIFVKIGNFIKEVFSIKGNDLYLEDKKVENEIMSKKEYIENTDSKQFIFIPPNNDFQLDKNMISNISNQESIYFKPEGGLWGSTYLKQQDENAPYASMWEKYINENDNVKETVDKGYVFSISEDANICEIKTKEEFDSLVEQFHIIKDKNIEDDNTIERYLEFIIEDYYDDKLKEGFEEIYDKLPNSFEEYLSLEDKKDFVEEYKEILTYENLNNNEYESLYDIAKSDDFSVIIDYEKMSEQYDGLYISQDIFDGNSKYLEFLEFFDLDSLIVFDSDKIEWDNIKEIELDNNKNEDYELNNISFDYRIPKK